MLLFRWLILLLSFAAAVLTIAVAAIVVLKPFFGERRETPRAPHEAPSDMLAGPVVLAGLSLLLGVLPFLAADGVLVAAAGAVAGEPLTFYLSLWHGINLPLIMSLAFVLTTLAVCASALLLTIDRRLRRRL